MKAVVYEEYSPEDDYKKILKVKVSHRVLSVRKESKSTGSLRILASRRVTASIQAGFAPWR